MKYSLILGALTQAVSAHYFFDTTTVNSADSTSFQYIRDFTRPTRYNPIKFSSNPAEDLRDNSTIDGPDSRCNQGAFTFADSTDILTVAAGDEVRVQLGVGATMQHPGPALVYMSRAPDDSVKIYDGSGEWFKIFEEGVCNTGGDFTNDAWCTWDRNWVAATIPTETPSGQYLMRFEHIGIHKSFMNEPEHFVSCVQVEVTNGGSGTPGPTVLFPGAYKDTDEYANFGIYEGVKDFPFPGPAVWASGSSAASGSTAANMNVSSVSTNTAVSVSSGFVTSTIAASSSTPTVASNNFDNATSADTTISGPNNDTAADDCAVKYT